MAVVDVKESWKDSPANWSSPDGREGEFVTTRKFTVTVDNAGTADRSTDVLVHPEIPQSGDSHPHNPYLKCRQVTATPAGPAFYEVLANYKATTPDPDESPLDQPATIKWSTVTEQGDIDEDISGNPIQTANGEPFKGIKKPFSDLKATITKNFAGFDSTVFYAYRDTTNAALFLGFPIGSAKIMNISADQVYDEDLPYFSITVEIQFRKPIQTSDLKAWYKRIRHEGLYERTGVAVAITSGGGSGAGGVPVVTAGAVASISVLTGGYGYTSPPTVTLSGGGGSGATATATVTNEEVTSISVGAGGSGYDDTKIIHAVDDNNAEVKKPIMLKLDGTRETDPKLAHWIEKEVFESSDFDALNLF